MHNLGSQLSGLPKTFLQKAKAIFPRSRPILFRFLWFSSTSSLMIENKGETTIFDDIPSQDRKAFQI